MFGDDFDDMDLGDFKPAEKPKPKTKKTDPKIVQETAKKTGFTRTSGQAKPIKEKPAKPKAEPTDQINFRAKISVLQRFRDLGQNQEPAWSLGYTLERAITALERELDKK